MKGNNPILIPLCTVKQRNAVMRNWVTWLKPREELVAESGADPNNQLPGLSPELMPLLFSVDGCVNSSWWSQLSLKNGPEPHLATIYLLTMQIEKVDLLALITWCGLGLHPCHIEQITLPKVSECLIPQWYSSSDSAGEMAPISVEDIKFRFCQFEVCRGHQACYRNDAEGRTV